MASQSPGSQAPGVDTALLSTLFATAAAIGILRYPLRCFREVTFPNIWPAVLGAFIISFILGFNNFEITFYNVAAIPTLPTIAWGTLRHGIEPELYALATIVNALVFVLLFIIYLLIRVGAIRLGVPDK